LSRLNKYEKVNYPNFALCKVNPATAQRFCVKMLKFWTFHLN